MVIGIIMVVGILSTVILRVVSNHARFTHHQVSRIQAQYAAKAGVIYALDKLRLRLPADAASWPPVGPFPYTRYLSSSLSACVPAVPPASVVIEPALVPTDPYHSPVSCVAITVNAPAASGPLAGTQKVSATATYTYTPL